MFQFQINEFEQIINDCGKYPKPAEYLSFALLELLGCNPSFNFVDGMPRIIGGIMGKDYDGDYQFGQASQFNKSFRNIAKSIKTTELLELVTAYQLNMERVISMNAVPIEVFHWSGVVSRAYCAARVSRGLSITDESQDLWPDTRIAVQKAYSEIMETRNKSGAVTAADRAWADGTRFIKLLIYKLFQQQPPHAPGAKEYFVGGIEAILSSMLVMSYGAFETLATDMWVQAVNSNKSLASNWIKKNQEKNMRMEEIAGYDFDMSKSMGIILYQSGKARFQTLNDLKDCYVSAFGAEIEKCFEPMGDLITAEKVRHLFAHRGGLIDKKFKREIENYYPQYSTEEIGKRLTLNGADICKHIEACVKTSMNLLEFVDKRLSPL